MPRNRCLLHKQQTPAPLNMAHNVEEPAAQNKRRKANGLQKHKREHDPRAVLVDRFLRDGTPIPGIIGPAAFERATELGGALNVMYK